MAEPLDAVIAIHNALRGAIVGIDATALKAAGDKGGPALTVERFHFFNEVLVWHHKGEELGIFPAIEKVAPSVAESYAIDHHGLDNAYDNLNAAASALNRLETARSSAALKFFLNLHLDKEEEHLYRLMKERIPMPEQATAVGVMASTVPPERFPELIAWMFPLLGNDDRENMTRIWQMVLPAERFVPVSQLIRKAIGDDWAELVRRIPNLGQE